MEVGIEHAVAAGSEMTTLPITQSTIQQEPLRTGWDSDRIKGGRLQLRTQLTITGRLLEDGERDLSIEI